jgi:resuscitation-promoting factor RpfB
MHKRFRQTKKRFVIAKRKRIRTLKLISLHPVAVPIVTFLSLAVLTSAGFFLFTRHHTIQTDSKIVIISHDHVEQTVPTHEPTVGALLAKLQIKLNQGDVVEPDVATPINQDDFRINVYRAVPVEIVDGSNKTFTFSAATTPRSIANQANVAVYPEDNLDTLPTTNFLKEAAIGERVVIDRATPVHINLYGTELDIRTHAKTVGDVLKDQGITLGIGDSVKPALDSVVQPEQLVFVLHKGIKVTTKTESIAMPVKTLYDSGLAYGTQAVRQKGSPGERVVTYQVNTQNGKEVSRKVIQSVLVQQPVTQIVVVGTSISGIKGDMALAGISPNDYTYADYIISHESGWCPTKAQGEIGSCPAYAGYVPSYGGYGLCQSTPGIKMSSAGSDWATNPITQLRWCSGYAEGRYGSWYAAYQHWAAYHNW